MKFIDTIKDLFNFDKKKALEEIKNDRAKMKEKLSIQLKEQCFMDEKEIKQVLDVIDDCFKKMDEYQKSIDYKNYNFETDRKFESGLIKLRNELDTKTKEKINEIMQIKLQKARKFFNK